MSKLNQKGFGFFYWLLILLILALLGFGGWTVWKKQKAKQAPAPAAQQSPNAQATPQAEEANYLVIAEWGVRVKLTESVKTAYYKIKPGMPNYAYLSLTSLQNTDCAADKTTLGVYARINNLSDVNEDTAGADGQTYAQMGYGTSPTAGGKYYYFTQPQAYCSNNQAQDQAYWTEFKDTLPTVEVSP